MKIPQKACEMDLIRGFKDNCGFGLIANIKNTPTHENVEDAITALERMMHRGAIAADGKSRRRKRSAFFDAG